MSGTATPAPAAPVSAVARRARVAGSLGFAAQGFVFAMILTSLDSFKDRYGIDDLAISAVILGVCVMAGVGTLVADRIARTPGGSRAVLGTGLLVVASAVVVVAVAPAFALLCCGFAVYGIGLGMVDAGTNMQAVAVQGVYGKSLLTSFYASWSVGGIVGTVLIAVSTGRVPTEPVALTLLLGTVVAALTSVVVWRGSWRERVATADEVATPAEPRIDPVKPVIPWAPLLLLGLGVVAYYVNDQAISTWSPIFMHEVLDTAGTITKLGYAAYLAMTLVSRLAGDPCVRRWGRAAVVRVASLVGAAGLAPRHHQPGARAGRARLRRRRRGPRPDRAAVLLGRRGAGARARGRGRRPPQRLQLRGCGPRRRVRRRDRQPVQPPLGLRGSGRPRDRRGGLRRPLRRREAPRGFPDRWS